MYVSLNVVQYFHVQFSRNFTDGIMPCRLFVGNSPFYHSAYMKKENGGALLQAPTNEAKPWTQRSYYLPNTVEPAKPSSMIAWMKISCTKSYRTITKVPIAHNLIYYNNRMATCPTTADNKEFSVHTKERTFQTKTSAINTGMTNVGT